MGFSSVLVIKGCRLYSATISHNSHRGHANNFLEVTHTRVFMVQCHIHSLWSKLGFIGKLTIGSTCTPLNLLLLIMEIRDGKYPLSHLVHFPARVKLLPVCYMDSAWSSFNVSEDVQAPDLGTFFFSLTFRRWKNRRHRKRFPPLLGCRSWWQCDKGAHMVSAFWKPHLWSWQYHYS